MGGDFRPTLTAVVLLIGIISPVNIFLSAFVATLFFVLGGNDHKKTLIVLELRKASVIKE